MKMTPCPHCRRTGCLILHGYLYGYDENGSDRVKRGKRIFCSNRKNKQGCGKTFSMLMAGMIKSMTIGAARVWNFLDNVRQGIPVSKAFSKTGTAMTVSSAYRIFKRFKENQPRIRTLLMSLKDPPVLPGVEDPAVCTLVHLESVFHDHPISAFQNHFQISFL